MSKLSGESIMPGCRGPDDEKYLQNHLRLKQILGSRTVVSVQEECSDQITLLMYERDLPDWQAKEVPVDLSVGLSEAKSPAELLCLRGPLSSIVAWLDMATKTT